MLSEGSWIVANTLPETCFLLQGELGDIGPPGPPIVINREGVVISGTCLHFVLELV